MKNNETKMVRIDGRFNMFNNNESIAQGDSPWIPSVTESDYQDESVMTTLAINEGRHYVESLADESDRNNCTVDIEFESVDSPKTWTFTYSYATNDCDIVK